MKIHFLMSVAGLLLMLSGSAAAEPEPVREIHEAFPETPPPGRLPEPVEPPTPVSVDMPEAFRGDVNAHELVTLTDADFAEADRKEKLADELEELKARVLQGN